MLTDDELQATLRDCSLRLKHVLLLARYAPPDDPFVARNCRVRIAKQLEAKGLVETRPVGRLDWLYMEPTPDGERAIEILVEKTKVRARAQAMSERMNRR